MTIFRCLEVFQNDGWYRRTSLGTWNLNVKSSLLAYWLGMSGFYPSLSMFNGVFFLVCDVTWTIKIIDSYVSCTETVNVCFTRSWIHHVYIYDGCKCQCIIPKYVNRSGYECATLCSHSGLNLFHHFPWECTDLRSNWMDFESIVRIL